MAKNKEKKIGLETDDLYFGNSRESTLALFVLGVGANDHYPTVAANHPALLTHFLD